MESGEWESGDRRVYVHCPFLPLPLPPLPLHSLLYVIHIHASPCPPTWDGRDGLLGFLFIRYLNLTDMNMDWGADWAPGTTK